MGDRTGAVTSEPGVQCQNYLKAGMTLRRLTPRECERLQGFPDDWTLVDGMADSPRYRMLGNAVAVPVADAPNAVADRGSVATAVPGAPTVPVKRNFRLPDAPMRAVTASVAALRAAVLWVTAMMFLLFAL